MTMEKYIVLEKKVGETPLSCAEAYRSEHPELEGVPMAYAGRLDPMASGKLLILLGDECKQQEQYHGLDKEYEFSVLLGIQSDTQDVLGRLSTCLPTSSENIAEEISQTVKSLIGHIQLPYPHYSSKTVHGKALHTWTLEGRLNEIDIPTNKSQIHELELIKIEEKPRVEVANEARIKIDTIPPVTDLRKAIGNDFRRVDVRSDWENIKSHDSLPHEYTIAYFRCIASSGTYMRSLAEAISQKLDTCGLAWHIHRTTIGHYDLSKKDWVSKFE